MRARCNTRLAFSTILAVGVVVGFLTAASAQQPADDPVTTPVFTVVAQVPNAIYSPIGAVIAQGRNGDLYTTAPNPLSGEVISATTSGAMAGLYNVGGFSVSGVILGSDGNLYGTNQNGGTGTCGFGHCGLVYKVTPAGVETVVYSLLGTNGYTPAPELVQAPNGLFYGVAEGSTPGYGVIFSVSASGTYKVLHTFEGSDGEYPHTGLTIGSDGNLYGGTSSGGAHNAGVLFRITPSGVYTVLHNFCSETNCTDGQDLETPLALAGDGNLYGMTYRSGSYGNTDGYLFRLTNGGTYTVLGQPGWTINNGLTLGTDGKLYGIFGAGGAGNNGQIFSMTTSGVVTILHKFCQETNCPDGYAPSTPAFQHTDGKFYGFTSGGGTCSRGGCGVFYSLDMGLAPFINLSTYSGSIGSAVGIFGQGFDSASVVKFNGVAAKIVLSGTTYITATVPAGATDGRVTVTTGTTTLASTKTFIVHNTWSKGAAMPTGTVFSSAAVLNGEIYVIGGDNASGTVVSDLQIYNPATNTWSTGTSLPVATDTTSAAVVNNILYVFGGSPSGGGATNAVWAYSPTTKKWTGKAAMLTARNGTLAVVENGIIYVIGGNLGGGPNFVATVESYNPATNTWKTEASMDGAKDVPGGGLIGTTIVVADGAPAGSVVTGDTEGYNAATNKWTELTADPTARTGPCSGVVGGILDDISGYINNAGAATTLNESFNLSTDKWTTTLAPIPQGTMFPASAVANGQLYCFGGWAVVNASAISNVQIYQP